MDKKKIYKKIIWSIISILLAILTISTILGQSKAFSLAKLIEVVKASDKLWFGAAAVSSLLYVWFEGTAIRVILKEAGYVKKRSEALIYSTADVYFSAITPSATGGQPASAYFMLKDGVPGGVITATLVLNLIMYNLSLGFLGIIAIVLKPEVVSGFGPTANVFIVFGTCALSLLSIFFYLTLKKGEKVFGFISGIVLFLEKKGIIKNNRDKILGKIKKVEDDYSVCSDMISHKPRMLLRAFIWNFLQRTSQILVPVFVYLSASGSRNKALLLFSKQCLINIGYNYIPIPGAMGISDFLMIDGFEGIMGSDMAVGIEMISRGVSFYICVLLCGLVTLTAYFIKRAKNDRRI